MGDIVTFDRAALLLKEEVTYGTDPTPTGANDSILISSGRIRFAANKVTRDIDQAYLGARPFVLTGRTAFIEFDLELMGASTVDGSAPISPVLLLLGLAETITPTTGPVDYDPISSAFKSATGYFTIPSPNASGGVRHVITGLRGDATLTVAINGYARLRCVLQGDEAILSDNAMPTQTLSAFQKPVGVTKGTWQLSVDDGGGAFNVEGVELSLAFGNRVQLYETSETKCIGITGRDATGFIRIHDPALTDLNPYALAKDETLCNIVSVVDGGSTKKFTLNIPTAQLEFPERIDIDGASGLRVPFTALPSSAGNDEFNLEFS